jgi:hypothetical protein
MAAKPVDKAVAAAILIDWRVGQLSQQQIAEKHKVSKGLANKLCKGVEQDGAAIVTAGVQYQQALSGHDDRMVTAMTTAVDEITRKLKFFHGASMLVAKTVASKVQQDGMNASYQDLNAAAHALGRAQVSVLGKSPDTVIVNTTNAVQNTLPLVYTVEELRAINEMLESQC